MKTQIIPGHVRVYTLPWAVVLAVVAGLYTRSWLSVVGIGVFALGAFLGDQAVHLYQMEHSDFPPTWLEQQQQNHRWLFQALGLVVSGIGLLIVLASTARPH